MLLEYFIPGSSMTSCHKTEHRAATVILSHRSSCFIYLKPQRWNLEESHMWYLELITTLIFRKVIILLLIDLPNTLCAFVQEELLLSGNKYRAQTLLWVVCNRIMWEMQACGWRGDVPNRDISVNNCWSVQALRHPAFWWQLWGRQSDRTLIAFVAWLD